MICSLFRRRIVSNARASLNSSNGGNAVLQKEKICPSEFDLKFIHPEDFNTIPILSHGLDRVLFNPGVHVLRDLRTNVYNFDPILRNVCQPDEFNFDSIPKFVPPSQDKHLHAAAARYGSKFVSSTSSIAPSMSQIYFLISGMKPMNLVSRFTGSFDDEPQTFTQLSRSPVGVYLRPHRMNDGKLVRSLVAEKVGTDEDEKPNILMKLGNVLEKILTHSKGDFERMKRGAANPYIPKADETYNYLQASNFLLRSQLDCQDSRLPRKAFDLKSRSTLPIRMDIKNYQNYLGYRLHRSFGLYESFEREFFDLCRSALLKYNFQVRIGDMDGIFIAYHNTAEMFGFQYLTRTEMDEILYGNEVTGDAAFRAVLKIYENALLTISNMYNDDDTLRLTFSLNKDSSKLTIFSEVVGGESSAEASNSFDQFSVTVSNFINGFRSQDITLDPSGMDDWRIDYTLQQQKPNVADYESARRKASEGRSRPDAAAEVSGRLSVPIMRNARKLFPNEHSKSNDGPEILAPWTKLQ